MSEIAASFTTQQVHQPALAGIHDLPPEVLASAFETLIYTSSSDISLILPFTLVCRSWHNLIKSTPRLWGILTLHRHSNPRALAKRIAHAKASPLSITADTATRVQERQIGVQIKALANLVSNWVELDVGVAFLVAACDLDRNRDKKREEELGVSEPIGCQPVLGWVDMYRSLQTLTLARGGLGHETPGAFFTHGGGVPASLSRDVKLHTFTSISLPKKWILGFLGPHIKSLHLLRGERMMKHMNHYWSSHNTMVTNSSTGSHYIGIEDQLTILSHVPNATHIELERTIWSSSYLPPVSFSPNGRIIYLPFLRDFTMRGVLYASLILAALRAPALQTLSIDRTDRTWDEPLAPVFAQWMQPGWVMESLHTLELINCLRREDDIPYLIRWLGKMKSLVRLFIAQPELKSPRGLEDNEEEEDVDEEVPQNLFKALASPLRTSGFGELLSAGWLCPSLMILRIDLPDTPIHTLISIARARGGIVPATSSSIPSPSRLRTIESRLCAAAGQADIDNLRTLVDNAQCMCMSCGLHLPLNDLTLSLED